MQKTKKYYGIYLNGDIPKLDEENYYRKEVEIIFEGKAYLLVKKENDQLEKVEIENKFQLKKEGVYKIEFINLANEKFQLQVRIEASCLLFIGFLIFLAFLFFLLFTKPIDAKNAELVRFWDYIDLAVLHLAQGKEKPKTENLPKNQYEFDLTLKESTSNAIDLTRMFQEEKNINRKIAPGDEGSFSIIISAKKSRLDRRYRVEFENLSNDKPSNLIFQIQGKNKTYATLQELGKNLKGMVKKGSERTIVIHWKWKYETGEDKQAIEKNDEIDTKEAESFNSYQFKIIVTGEEVEG